MRMLVELEPPSAEAARVLGEWQAVWGKAVAGSGVELATADSLMALLDLRVRCFDRGLTVNAVFPENSQNPAHG